MASKTQSKRGKNSNLGTRRRLDQVFELLSRAERRETIGYLYARPNELVTLDELGRQVARSDDEEENVRVALHHCHLPKLVDAGVVDYDEERTLVRYRGSSALDYVLRRFIEFE